MSLAAWVGSQVWFQQRLETRRGVSVTQQIFRLRHASEHHWCATWGHDLDVMAEALVESSVTDRHARFIEALGGGVRRQTRLVRLALDAQTRLEDVGHIAFRDTGLRSLGEHQLCFADNLAYGRPRARSRELRRALARWQTRPVVLWVGDGLTEELSLWRICAAMPARAAPTWLARVAVPLPAAPHELLMDALLGARTVSEVEVQRLARRWSAFCAGRRPRGALHRDFDAALPRRVGRRTRLAARDVELLRPFDAWRTPLQVLRANHDAWPLALFQLSDELPSRLLEWAQGPLLEHRAAPGRAPWASFEFRLTAAGHAALSSGVNDAAVLVPARFGGFRSLPR